MKLSNKNLALSIATTLAISASSISVAGDFQIMGSTNLFAGTSTDFSDDSRVKTRGYGGAASGKYFVTDIIGIGAGVAFSEYKTKSTNGNYTNKSTMQNLRAGPEVSAEVPLTDKISIEGVLGIYKIWEWADVSHSNGMYNSYKSTFNKGWAKRAGVNVKLALNESVSLVLGTSYMKTKGIGKTNNLGTSLGLAFNF